MKKFVTRFLVVAMLVLGACMLHTDGNTVLAAETTTENTSTKEIYTLVENVQGYRSESGYTYPKPTGTEAEGKEDWVFAGWYYQGSNSNYVAYSEAGMSDVTSAYAKYVPAEVLSTKFQVSAGTNAASEKASLRVVTSIDSRSYQKVGFELKSGRTGVTKSVESTTVFKRIRTATEGLDYGYSPIIFDTVAEYFMTVTIANIKNANFDYSYIATPYWVTLDGTTVYGVTRSAKVSDSYNGIANVPVRLYTDEAETSGTVIVTYNKDAFTYQGVEQGTLVSKDVTVTDNNGTLTFAIPDGIPAKPDGMLANLRFKVLDSALSNEVFVITGVNGVSDYNYQVYSTYYDADKGPDTSWYDNFKDESAFVIATANDLYGFAKIVDKENPFAGKTVYLGADITVNKGEATETGWEKDQESDTLHPWTAIHESSTGFAGTFDGDGHTINGIYLDETKSTLTQYYGFFGRTAQGSVVRNFSLKNSYFNVNVTETVDASYAFLGSIVGLAQGDVDSVYSKAYVVSDGETVGGLFGRVNTGSTSTSMTINNCQFDGEVQVTRPYAQYCFKVGGVTGGAFRGNITISNCHMSGTVKCLYPSGGQETRVSVGGVIGYFEDSANMTIENCFISGSVAGYRNGSFVPVWGVGAFVGSNDNSKSTLTIRDSYATKESNTAYGDDGNLFFCAKAFQITYQLGNDITNYPNNSDSLYLVMATDAQASLTGYANRGNVNLLGIYSNAEKDDSNYWVITEGMPELKAFCDEWADFGWYDTNQTAEEDTFVIETAEEFRSFASIVNGGEGFSGKTVKLADDIVVNEGLATKWAEGSNTPQSWTPIGNGGQASASIAFQGTFDGDGHTIRGVYLKNDSYYQGLFGNCNGATIKNVRLINSYFENNAGCFGSVVGLAEGNSFIMENVYSDAIIKSQAVQIGGLVGYVQMSDATKPANMTSCWFDGDISVVSKTAQKIYVGGLAGFLYYGNLVLDTCYFTGDIDADYGSLTGSWEARVAGFLGTDWNGTCSVSMKNSLSAGTIELIWNSNTISNPRCNQFLGYNNAGSGENLYPLSTITLYTASGTINRSQSSVDITGETWDYQASPSQLYGANAKFKTNLPFGTVDRTDGGTAYWVAMDGALPVPSTLADAKDGKVVNVFAGNGTESNPYLLMDAEQFMLFEELSQTDSFEGKYVALGDNIVVNEGLATDWAEGENAPSSLWTAIGNSTYPFKGTFDGQGHTISGVYMKTSAFYQGLFSYCNGATIRDVRLVNSYFENTKQNTDALMGSIVGWACGTGLTMENVYSDAIINSTGYEIGGLIGYAGENDATQVNMTSCWFDGDINVEFQRAKGYGQAHTGGHIGVLAAGTLVMDTCYFTGDIDVSYVANVSDSATAATVGGFVGTTLKQVQIKNSLSAGTIDVTWNMDANAGVTDKRATIIQANQFIGNYGTTGSTVENTYALSSIYGHIDGKDPINRSGAEEDVTDITTGGAVKTKYLYAASEIYGTNAKSKTVLPFAVSDRTDGGTAIWATVDGKLPVPATLSDVNEGKAATILSGEGTESKPYLITSTQDLVNFANLSQTYNFADKYVALENDIVINEGETAEAWAAGTAEPTVAWQYPIGVAADGKRFAGVFDGKYHTISGICFDTAQTPQTYLGLFAATEVGSEIKNLRLENSYFNQQGETAFTGSVVGECRGSLNNIYSNAIVTSVTAQTGGIMGRANGWDYQKNLSNEEARIEQTISNCWYDGIVNMTATNLASSDTGGIIGSLIQGEWTLTNCLFTGELNSAYAGGGLSYAGGLCGSVWSASDNNASTKEAKLIVNSCVSAGTINTTIANAGHGAGAIVGRMNAQEGIKTHLTLNNVFTTRESGAQVVGDAREVGGSTPSISGYTVWVTNSDRLIGYFNEDTTSEYAGAKLDFSSDWIIRIKGTPVPATFADFVDAVDPSSFETVLGLSKTTLGKAVHYGQGKYVITLNSNKSNCESYINDHLVGTSKFKVHASTSDTNVYNTILTKQGGDWVLNVHFAEITGKMTITIQTGIKEVLSPNLIASNVTQSGTDTVSLGMLQLTGTMCDFSDLLNSQGYEDYYYGNSFVIKLPDGHFIINDGGATNDFDGLIQYLKQLAGIAETDMTTKIYVDAWTVSHQHSDHFGVVRGFYDQNKKALAAQVCVEAFYINEPNNRAIDYVDGSLSETLEKQCRGMQVLRTKSGDRTPVYSYQTGQRYYFNGVTMDVIQSQEQLLVADYAQMGYAYETGTDYNTTSTNLIFTIGSGTSTYKVFLNGDSNYVNMQYIMNTYGTDSALLKGINVYQAPHHGKNTSMSLTELDNSFTDYLTTGLNGSGYKFDFTLFPCSVYYEAYDKTHEAIVYPYAGKANEHLISLSNGYWNYGSGTVNLTFGTSITSALQSK